MTTWAGYSTIRPRSASRRTVPGRGPVGRSPGDVRVRRLGCWAAGARRAGRGVGHRPDKHLRGQQRYSSQTTHILSHVRLLWSFSSAVESAGHGETLHIGWPCSPGSPARRDQSDRLYGTDTPGLDGDSWGHDSIDARCAATRTCPAGQRRRGRTVPVGRAAAPAIANRRLVLSGAPSHLLTG